MSRFRISKTGVDTLFPWELYYPVGFDDLVECDAFTTFDDAVVALQIAAEAQCPQCGRGEVIDTHYGWSCRSCGSYDVAVDCPEPTPKL